MVVGELKVDGGGHGMHVDCIWAVCGSCGSHG